MITDPAPDGEHRTWCRLCPAHCGVIVTTSEGRPVKVVGDRDDPLSRGYVCPKGRKMVTLADHPSRLDHPMLRDRRGRLVAVEWSELLDDLAGRLGDVRDRLGGYGIASYAGTMYDAAGRSAAMRLMAALDSPSSYSSLTIDAISKILVTKLMSGHERPWPQVDHDATDLLLVLGENVVVSHGGYSYLPDPIRHLRRVTERGELWVVDPRATATARAATRHLVPRVGSDFALLAHLVREVLVDGADVAYLAEHARHVDELATAVAPFDATTTASLTGIAEADLGDLLAAVRRHGRLAVVTGTGVSMADTANVAEWLAMALQVVTGSLERPGGRWFNHGPLFDPTSVPPPDTSLAPGPRTRPHLARLAGQFPCSALAGEIEAGHVGALLVLGGNPMTAFPQPDRLGAALDRLDVLAVWDLVDTATVERATHVLPCPDPLERPELRLPLHVPAVFVHHSDQVVARREGRRSMWWSLASLADRLGVPILPARADRPGPDDWTDDDVLALQLASAPFGLDELRAAGGRIEVDRVDRWVEEHLLPDGRWDVAPEVLRAQLADALARPRSELVLANRREVGHTNSLLLWTRDGEPLEPRLEAHPDDAAGCGVADGDLVEVSSRHGSVTGRLTVTDAIARGTLTVPHGFVDPNVGRLASLDHDVDPITGMPTLVGVPLTLRPAPEA